MAYNLELQVEERIDKKARVYYFVTAVHDDALSFMSATVFPHPSGASGAAIYIWWRRAVQIAPGEYKTMAWCNRYLVIETTHGMLIPVGKGFVPGPLLDEITHLCGLWNSTAAVESWAAGEPF